MAPELVYLVAAVWISMARFDKTLFHVLELFPKADDQYGLMLVFSIYLLLSIANQMARGPIII